MKKTLITLSLAAFLSGYNSVEASGNNNGSNDHSTEIDVLSEGFKDEYFNTSGEYEIEAIKKGMTQEEVEEKYGEHDLIIQVEGANLAIYGNIAVQYEGAYLHSDQPDSSIDGPEDNEVIDTYVYIGESHEDVLEAYGEPILDHDEYEIRGPGEQEMIYESPNDEGEEIFLKVMDSYLSADGSETVEEPELVTFIEKGSESSEERIETELAVERNKEETEEKDESNSTGNNYISSSEYEKDENIDIVDMEPNALARAVNSGSFSTVDEDDADREDVRQSFDIDGDGNDEDIEILKNDDIDEGDASHGRYILVIYDHQGEAKFAEYLYTYASSMGAPTIVTVADINQNGYMEITVDNVAGIEAELNRGFQSVSQFTFGMDQNLQQYTQLPSLGRFFDNEYVEPVEIAIEDKVSSMTNTYSYEPIIEGEQGESFLNEYNSGDEDNIRLNLEEDAMDVRGYSFPEFVAREDTNDYYDLIFSATVFPSRIATVNLEETYTWNPEMEWMEIVGEEVKGPGEGPSKQTRDVFAKEDFNDKFNTQSFSFGDYQGEWTGLEPHGNQDKSLVIDSDGVEDIDERTEHTMEIDVDADEFVMEEDTNQLIVNGPSENSFHSYSNDYHNIFTLMDIDGEVYLMDKVGMFYEKK